MRIIKKKLQVGVILSNFYGCGCGMWNNFGFMIFTNTFVSVALGFTIQVAFLKNSVLCVGASHFFFTSFIFMSLSEFGA